MEIKAFMLNTRGGLSWRKVECRVCSYGLWNHTSFFRIPVVPPLSYVPLGDLPITKMGRIPDFLGCYDKCHNAMMVQKEPTLADCPEPGTNKGPLL